MSKDEQRPNDQKIHGSTQNRPVTGRMLSNNVTSTSKTNTNTATVQSNSRMTNRSQQNDRFAKKPNEMVAGKSSVQSRLANVKKQISLDQVDFVETHQPTQTMVTSDLYSVNVKVI